MIYKPQYFSLRECFPPDTTQRWDLMDERILITADALREIFGPLWINGRGLTQCGFRTNGSSTSQHRFGRALDLHSDNHSSESMRKYIINHPESFPHITFLEVDISWLHIDCRWSWAEQVFLWSPTRWGVSIKNYLKIGDIK